MKKKTLFRDSRALRRRALLRSAARASRPSSAPPSARASSSAVPCWARRRTLTADAARSSVLAFLTRFRRRLFPFFLLQPSRVESPCCGRRSWRARACSRPLRPCSRASFSFHKQINHFIQTYICLMATVRTVPQAVALLILRGLVGFGIGGGSALSVFAAARDFLSANSPFNFLSECRLNTIESARECHNPLANLRRVRT